MINFPSACDRISNTSYLFFALVGTIVLLLVSCKQSDDIQKENLYGRWEITKAERNGRETSYLRNGYFIINTDGTITINITGEDEIGKYSLDNNKLMMDGNKIFDIQALQDDSLTVKYIAAPNSQFLIYLLKKKEDVQ